MSRDVGHAHGDATYEPAPPPCAGCGHAWLGHDIGARAGTRVRTRCLHGDAAGQCPCKAYTAPDRTAEPAAVTAVTPAGGVL